MTRYIVLKPRFVLHGHAYYQGNEFESQPNSLLRRAVRDGDLNVVGKPVATAEASTRKPKGDGA